MNSISFRATVYYVDLILIIPLILILKTSGQLRLDFLDGWQGGFQVVWQVSHGVPAVACQNWSPLRPGVYGHLT